MSPPHMMINENDDTINLYMVKSTPGYDRDNILIEESQ